MQKSIRIILNELIKEANSCEEFVDMAIESFKASSIKLLDLLNWLENDGYDSLEDYYFKHKEKVA